MPDFTRRGGMIQLVLQDRHVRFEVNLAAAEHAGLTLSSQLLKLAVAVRKTP
jgi:YfiR/HmsC-like